MWMFSLNFDYPAQFIFARRWCNDDLRIRSRPNSSRLLFGGVFFTYNSAYTQIGLVSRMHCIFVLIDYLKFFFFLSAIVINTALLSRRRVVGTAVSGSRPEGDARASSPNVFLSLLLLFTHYTFTGSRSAPGRFVLFFLSATVLNTFFLFTDITFVTLYARSTGITRHTYCCIIVHTGIACGGGIKTPALIMQ